MYYAAGTTSISYPEHGNDIFYRVEESSFWFKHRNNCILALVNKFCAKDTVFFDVGGGNGFVSKGIQDMGIESVLLEPGAAGAANARKRGVKNIICSAFQDLEFFNESLPAVGLFDVVEHMEDDTGFLRTINARMGKGGLVFISVPAHQFLWSDEDPDAGHFRRYTLKLMKKKLYAAGFNVIYSTYFFNFLLLPMLFFRAVPYRLGFKTLKNSLKERKEEHTAPAGIGKALIDFFSAGELKKISNGKEICSGASCLVVAKK